jgi:hypothetical protein
MERGLLLDRLNGAYQRVAESERDVAEQRDVVAALEREERDSNAERELLGRYETELAMHIADRARLLEELLHHSS